MEEHSVTGKKIMYWSLLITKIALARNVYDILLMKYSSLLANNDAAFFHVSAAYFHVSDLAYNIYSLVASEMQLRPQIMAYTCNSSLLHYHY